MCSFLLSFNLTGEHPSILPCVPLSISTNHRLVDVGGCFLTSVSSCLSLQWNTPHFIGLSLFPCSRPIILGFPIVVRQFFYSLLCGDHHHDIVTNQYSQGTYKLSPKTSHSQWMSKKFITLMPNSLLLYDYLGLPLDKLCSINSMQGIKQFN